MSRRLLVRTALGLIVLAAAVTGAVVLADRPEPQAASAPVAAILLETVATADRVRFEGLFARDADPQRVEVLWSNLGRIELVGIEPGPDGPWRVSWRVPGEAGIATHLVAPAWSCRPEGCRLTDLGQHPGAPAPIWLTGAISVHEAGRTAVIGPDDARLWLIPAARAARETGAATPAGLLRPALLQVVEVPQDRHAFEQVMAAPAMGFRGTGAITWTLDSVQPGDPAEPATTRIVINPDATKGLDEQARFLLLVHEQGHAATSWLGPPASGRGWVSEGFAEWFMLQRSAVEQNRSAAILRASCPLPAIPPADADFADPRAQPLAYAWSAAAIDQIMAQDDDPVATITKLWQDPDAHSAPPADPCR